MHVKDVKDIGSSRLEIYEVVVLPKNLQSVDWSEMPNLEPWRKGLTLCKMAALNLKSKLRL